MINFGTACITLKHPKPFIGIDEEYPVPSPGFYARTEWKGENKRVIVEAIDGQHTRLEEAKEAARLARLLDDKQKGWFA